MSLAILLAAALQTVNVSGGVEVSNSPQIGIATRHARCIVRRIGVAPRDEGARQAAIDTAISDCRAYVESDFTQGRVQRGDRLVSGRWWRGMQRTLDAIERDVAEAIVTPKQYKIIWQLPDGGRVDVYNAPGALTSVRLLTVPL
ncbi:hypothetical protein [Sphingomonas xinjiangensis]|uniref:Uncharacterized protein n=1 Tax=Sphingomonas xinjiangensis TaxID=643568 RepID=A0A840YPS2_9SPHN|nr:hypothetical protein [Sphingomonas xinjiangensis]MBB5710042.1 hypothetical protein [Sphingomonas xinjiangensis]